MSIKRNFIYNAIYQILIIILPLITTPYISRVIGPEGIGIQSYTYSIVNYFVLFSMLGISNYGNREIAMVRDDKEKLSKKFTSIYSMHIIISIVVIILYVIYILFFVKNYKIFFIIQSIYIVSALLDINWFFFGVEQFKLTVIRNTTIKILSALCIFLFVKETNDLYIYSLILAIGMLLSNMVLWRFIKRYIKFTKVSKKEILVHFKPMLILFIPVISISIYKIMAKIMLGSMSNVMQVGYYENSEKIINIPIGIITALGTVMLPKMSNLQAKGQIKKFKRYISISIEFIMFIAFGAMFGLIGISKVFIPIFLGDKFVQCTNIVSVLAITILFLSWANVIRTQFLIPRKKDKIYIGSTILGAIVNLLFNILLISKYGALGAAVGTVFAEATVAIYQTIMVRKELNIQQYFKRTIFYMIPGIIMYITIQIIGYKFEATIMTGILQIIVGGLIYLIISLLYMIYIKNEIVINIINNYKIKLFKK